MKNYILYDELGEIKSSGTCYTENDLNSQRRDNLNLLEISEYISINDGYVLNNQYIPFTLEQKFLKNNKPYYPVKWNNISMSWEDLRSPQQKIDQQWYIVKSQRDQFLQQSDWRVVKASDTGIPLSQEWKDYRQALRDITTQADPFNIIWPTPPTA